VETDFLLGRDTITREILMIEIIPAICKNCDKGEKGDQGEKE
jgi:hypothetical protein